MPPTVHGRYLVYDFDAFVMTNSRLEQDISVEGFRRWPLVLGLSSGIIGRVRRPGVVVVESETMRAYELARRDGLRDFEFARCWRCRWQKTFDRVWRSSLVFEAQPGIAPPRLLRSYLNGFVALQAFCESRSGLSLREALRTILLGWRVRLADDELDYVSTELARSPVMPHFARLHAGLLRLVARWHAVGRLNRREVARFVRRCGYFESMSLRPGPLESFSAVLTAVKALADATPPDGIKSELASLSDAHRSSLERREEVWSWLRGRCLGVEPDDAGGVRWAEFEALIDCWVGEEEMRRWLLLRAMRNLRTQHQRGAFPLRDLTLASLLQNE